MAETPRNRQQTTEVEKRRESRSRGAESRSRNVEGRSRGAESRRYTREVDQHFSRLGNVWKGEINKSYSKFSDKKTVTDIFAVTKKYNRKDVPQSMVATVLLNYADNVQGQEISAGDVDALLEKDYKEYVALKELQQEFEQKKGTEEFEEYEKFMATQKKTAPTTIAEIRQSKGFTTSTYSFYTYLQTSFAKSDNKEEMLQKLSKESQTTFVSYTQTNTRLSKVITLPESFTVTVTQSRESGGGVKVEVTNQTNRQEPKGFANAADVFTRDIANEQGPKKILDSVDANTFGDQWLEKDDFVAFRNLLKDIALEQRDVFLRLSAEPIPNGVNAGVMKQFVDTGTLPESAIAAGLQQETLEQYFEKVVVAYFVEHTKKRMQQMVLEEYFSQVSGLLDVIGGNISLDNSVQYNEDGKIVMKYVTTRQLTDAKGNSNTPENQTISGEILIDQDGAITIQTPMGYDESNGMQFSLQNMYKKIPGKLPNMKTMLQNCATQKDTVLQSRKESLESVDEDFDSQTDELPIQKNISTEAFYGVMVSQQDETNRTIIENPLKKELLLVQSVDTISDFIQKIALKQGVDPNQETFLQYIKNPHLRTGVSTLVLDEHPELEPLFILRKSVLQGSLQQTENILRGIKKIENIYLGSALPKDKYPFVIGGQNLSTLPAGKTTIWSFLSYFCIGEPPMERFDDTLFSNAIFKLEEVARRDINTLSTLQASHYMIPRTSLYYKRNPELLAQLDEVTMQTNQELASLKGDIFDSTVEKQIG